MEDSGRDAMRARNDELHDQINTLLGTFEQQRQGIAEAQATLANTTVTAWSSDNMVRVVSNAAGVPIEVHLEPEAFKRSTPERLGSAITETVQSAARQAAEATRQAVAPLEAATSGGPDLSDLVPGVPGIRDLVRTLFPEPSPKVSKPVLLDEEDEDEYYRKRSYLEERP